MKLHRDILLILDPLLSVEGLQDCLQEMGVPILSPEDALPAPLQDLVTNVKDLYFAVGAIADQITDGDVDLALVLEMIQTVRAGFVTIRGLEAALDSIQQGDVLDFPFDQPDFWTDLARRLPGHLLQRWVREYHPIVDTAMHTLGVWQQPPETGINLARINAFLADPGPELLALLQDDAREIDLRHIQDVVLEIVMILGLLRTREPMVYLGGATVPDLDAPDLGGLFGVELIPPGVADLVAVNAAFGVEARALKLLLSIGGAEEVTLALNDTWQLRGEAEAETDLALSYVPSGALNLGLDGAGASGRLSLTGRPSDPWSILSFGSGAGITLDAFSVAAEATLSAGSPELTLAAQMEQLKLAIDLREGDSFIADALPLEQFEIGLDFEALWSSTSGLSLAAVADTEFDIPLNISIGPIAVPFLRIGVTPTPEELEIWFGVTASADIAIMKVAIEDIGLKTKLALASEGDGVLGDIDLGISFRPPSGLGLAIGAPGSPISGGGYLRVDHDAGRYDGIIDLQIIKIGITAVVIIDTQALESGAWSMFFALFIRLPSIQLGFGISLEGVGGVAGINRTLHPPALLDAVRSGALGDILFPEDPIGDAPQIIAAYRDIFQPAQGRFLFGPVIKIAWAKGVVAAELGVVIDLPSPVIVAILGSISILLPPLPAPTASEADVATDEDLEPAIISLRLDTVGIFDFQAGTISVEAHLINSHIAGFPISGGMAMRAGFKDDPYFLLAVGGFHPGFPHPDGFPSVDRLAMSISIAGVIEISFETYFAVASNTVQFGAAIHLLADIEIFRIEGHFIFDALFAFDPLKVQIDLDLFVSVQAVGVDILAVQLIGSAVGPKPWTVSGRVDVDILGYRDGISINQSTGNEEEAPVVTPPGVLAMVEAELRAADALEAIDPTAAPGVTLAEPSDGGGPAPVSPHATLVLAQKAAPLYRVIDRFGTNLAIQHDRFLLFITSPLPGLEQSEAEDWFAPGHFTDLGNTDTAKLSAPSFERMQAGWELSGATEAGPSRAVTRDHKVVRTDPLFDPDAVPGPPPAVPTAETLLGAQAVFEMATSEEFSLLDGLTGAPAVTVIDGAFVAVESTSGALSLAETGSYSDTAGDMVSGEEMIRGYEAELLI